MGLSDWLFGKKNKYFVDNEMAIVPSNYFDTLKLEAERKIIKEVSKETHLGRFEYKTLKFNKSNDVNSDLAGFEVSEDDIDLDEFIDSDNDELSKGDKVYVCQEGKILKSYPKTVHLFMGGSGGYYTYYMGIASVLQEHFRLDNVIFAGVSGGTIVNLLMALEMDCKEMFEKWHIPLLQKVAKYRTGALFNWNKEAMESYYDHVPDDAYEKIKGRYYVYTTEFHYFSKWKNRMIGDFDNKKDLGDAILASCQVPILLGGDIYTYYRDEKFIDGVISYHPDMNVHYKEYPSVRIYADMWRPISYLYLWPWTSEEWHRKVFQWGVEDAIRNLPYLKQFFMPK
jgi:hypothetical protein